MESIDTDSQSNLLLRTIAMPNDTNSNGDIFGGWIMSQMDMAGSILAREISAGRTVTIAVNAMKFFKPVKVGDIVCCYGKLLKVGTTSVTTHLEVWVKPVIRENIDNTSRFKVTEADFTYVAIDNKGNKRPVYST